MQTMTEALYEMVHSDRGLARRVAARLGVNYQTLLNKLHPVYDQHRVHADEILPILDAVEHETGDRKLSDEPLHWLCAQRGGVFFRPPREQVTLADATRAALCATREFGETIGAFERATACCGPAGRRITDAELAEFMREAQQAQAAIAGFVALVRASRDDD